MSVRNALLALLEEGPRYGYQLRAEFEDRTGGTWPLNVGQVYTTLNRLERDGLVEGRVRYAITAAGRAELGSWFGSPVTARDRPRDELAIKLALAVTVPGVDVAAVVQRQRAATITHLQDLTRLKASGDRDLSWSLVVEAMRFQAEAEIRWLDHCETALVRAARSRTGTDSPGATTRTGKTNTGVRR